MIRTSRAPNNTTALIDGLEELANDKGDGLNTLDLFLSPKKLLAQVLGLVTDVVLNHCQLLLRCATRPLPATYLLELQELAVSL